MKSSGDLVQSIGPDIEARMPKTFLYSFDVGDQGHLLSCLSHPPYFCPINDVAVAEAKQEIKYQDWSTEDSCQ